jgi:hypothetical protein
MYKTVMFIAAASVSGLVSLSAQGAYFPKPVTDIAGAVIPIQAGEPGRANRGGDGGSLPGLPGGRGGRSGAAAADDDDDNDNRPRRRGRVYNGSLSSYCEALAKRRWWSWWKKPYSDVHEPDDCDAYWSRRGKRRGSDGPSIAGGSGGRGGRSGSGPGGGSGGSGGAGVVGGTGGRGGAGGSGY